MNDSIIGKNLRILVVDDNRAIHDDFRKILGGISGREGSLENAEALLFDAAAAPVRRDVFEIDSAYQGQEALALVEQALKEGRPYAMAFVDVRMPPGWDGVETTSRMWELCPDLQICICTAYSDYSWDEMSAKLHSSDRLVILKKPFDTVEVLQLANALTEKWRLHQAVKSKLDQLEKLVGERTEVLQQTNRELQAEIAERQRTADALRESEERYQLLFRRNPLPMWVFDLETLAFLAVNETAVRDYGYSMAEFLAMTIKDIRPAEALPNLLNNLADPGRLAASQQITRHRRKDGSIIDVEIISRLITFAGRQARLVLAHDITRQKQAQDQIHEQAALLDLAHDAIFVRDLQGRIQFWNKGAESLYGWKAPEALGMGLAELFPQDDVVAFKIAEKILMEKGEWSGELNKHTKDGQKIIVGSRWTLLRGTEGQPRSVLVINTDITEKKKLETQFLRSQRMEGIGTLATGMAHDLNNILAPILISAGALRWQLTPEERETAINRIEMSVKRGAGIIQQVLTFGRGVSGERAAINPGDLVEELSKIISETFPKDIALTLESDSDIWSIIGDKTQLHQVLLNLTINARDAMPQGGVLKVRAKNFLVTDAYAAAHSSVQAGPYVLLQVTDNGSGISAAHIERIFDPFFTTKEFGKGTGLGLSTVLGIVKSHHGLVTVESKKGAGTTFKVLLPASPEVLHRTTPGSTAALPRGNGQTILIVDDEVNIVAVAGKMMERNGYQVLVANHGKQALEIFARKQETIELVLTDIMMPDMDGVALIRALKKRNPQIKIIASSGLGKDLGGSLWAAELESLQVKCFLAKPYTAEKLLNSLHDLLGANADCPEDAHSNDALAY
jgi:two-component system, cell cycle sensor histidine kinase and response regulator CckA